MAGHSPGFLGIQLGLWTSLPHLVIAKSRVCLQMETCPAASKGRALAKGPPLRKVAPQKGGPSGRWDHPSGRYTHLKIM